MSKRSLALLLAALLTVGLLGAPTASASIFSSTGTSAKQADNFTLVSGLLDTLLRPGPHVKATLGHDDVELVMDGGIQNDAFVLHCNPPDTVDDKLRLRWSDGSGDHTWILIAPVETPQCTDGAASAGAFSAMLSSHQTYSAPIMAGLCDGVPTNASLDLTKGGGAITVALRLSGGCNVDDGAGGQRTGTGQGCLVFGSNPDACDNGGTSGPSYTGFSTGGAAKGAAAFEYRLECGDQPKADDHLSVVWGSNSFVLSGIEGTRCTDETPYTAPNDKNPFETQDGIGTGTCNGDEVAVGWTFQDNGEPSRNDLVTLEIASSENCPGLELDGKVTAGNLQAHPKKG